METDTTEATAGTRQVNRSRPTSAPSYSRSVGARLVLAGESDRASEPRHGLMPPERRGLFATTQLTTQYDPCDQPPWATLKVHPIWTMPEHARWGKVGL